MKTSPSRKQQDHPLADMILGVVLPVSALVWLSKTGDKFWHIGPLWGMIVALAIPLGYGVWSFAKTKKMNFFSAIGIFGVVATGGITLYVYNGDGSVKPSAAWLFPIKESLFPLIIAAVYLVTHFFGRPFFRTIPYTDELYDIQRIEQAVSDRDREPAYKRLIWHMTLLFIATFVFTALCNFFLARYFLVGIENTQEAYNAAVGKIMGWGYLVIGVPMLLAMLAVFWLMISGLKKITGLSLNELLLVDIPEHEEEEKPANDADPVPQTDDEAT